MAINKNNCRMYITFNKKQADWLRKCAKKCNLQISEFIKWLIDKNIGRIFAKLPAVDKEIISTISSDKDLASDQTEWDSLFENDESTEKNNDDELPF